MQSFAIHGAGPLMPDALVGLAQSAQAEGVANVSATIRGWTEGTQRFELPGESLLIALDESGEAVGVGGLTLCPHVDGAFRMRRFYVEPAWRRHGVARTLARRLLALAAQHTDTVTCNAAASAAAPLFWESMGFERSEVVGITHLWRSSHN